MKRTVLLFMTIFCIIHTTHAMKRQISPPNTKGITPLFDESDEQGIEHFNATHVALVNHIECNLLANSESKREYTKELRLAQIDLQLLRNQYMQLGPEKYVELVTQRDIKQQQEKELDDAFATVRQTIISEFRSLMREQGYNLTNSDSLNISD